MWRYIFLTLSFLFILSCNENSGNQKAPELAEETQQERVEDGSEVAGDDASFLSDAYYYNLLLTRYNELAANKTTRKSLQNFAEQSAEYHRIMNREIEQLAEPFNIELSSGIGDMAQEHIRELETKSGNDFDKAYLQVLNDIQEEMINRHQKASESAKDTNVRSWSEKFISNVKAHQLAVMELLEEIENK